MNKAQQRLDEIEQLINEDEKDYKKYPEDSGIFSIRLTVYRAEEQGILLGLEEGRKEAIEMIDIEKIAEIEHEQWIHWTKYMLDNLTDANIQRWKTQIQTPYSELSEKESDRKWARKVIENLKKEMEEK